MKKNLKIILSVFALCTLLSNGVYVKADTNKEYVLGKYASTNDKVNKADLIITTNKREIKKFNVDMNIVNDFINWYSERAEGRGEPFYRIYIPASDEFKTITFDEISSFEVDEYKL